MKWFALQLLLALIAVGLIAATAVAADINLTAKEDIICIMQGGCLFVTQEWLAQRLKAAHEAGRQEGADLCRRPFT